MQRTNLSETTPRTNAPEPRWPVITALLATGGLYVAMPQAASVGPRWLILILVAVLLVPTVITHHLGHVRVNVQLGYVLSGVVTLALLWSLGRLIAAVFAHGESPGDLLRSGALLWVANVLVSASWYWRLDAGGPHGRAQRLGHPTGAFLFPQMVMPEPRGGDVIERGGADDPWSPNFVDYLFLAFNTSSAFSPTDTAPLSRWAKVGMMMQSLISMTILLILVGRVVNII
jgi:hypothetical protein